MGDLMYNKVSNRVTEIDLWKGACIMVDNELLAAISNIIQTQNETLRDELREINTGLGRVEIRLEQIENRMDQLEIRMDHLETRLDQLETRMDHLETRLDQLEARMDQLETRMDQLETRMDRVEARLDRVENRIDQLEVRMDQVEKETNETRMLLENDISRKINIIGEGHDFLKQRLENALSMEMKREAMELHIVDMQIEMKKMRKLIDEHDEKLRKIS